MEQQSNQTQQLKREFGLSSLAVNNRTSVIIITFIIVLFGLNSYINMPKESFPEVVLPTIYVGTPYLGNSPVDMENLVTRPIEKELKSITGVKKISSTSIQDYSTIIVEFNPNVKIPKALQDVKDAVDKAKSELPKDLTADPNVFEVNLSDLPIMFVNISGDYSLDELKKHADFLEDEIEKLPEISRVDISGLREREVRITADIHQMQARQVNFGDIEAAIANENLTLSGGNLKGGGFQRSVRVVGEFKHPDEIKDIIVKSINNNIVYLRDVATVEYDYEERKSYARSSKLPVVTLSVVKRSGENLLNAADKIKEIIEKAQKSRFPKDLSIVITNDQSKQTRNQVSNLENSIISGVLLVILVLLFFLGTRNAIFVGIAIPLSMFMSFILLNVFGVTLNLMVLFSLILALGMLVDNGIVVVENTYRLLQQGMSPIRAAKQGVGEVAVAIIASTLTTVVAFLPLAFWQGIIGKFMYYLPVTLIIVLSSSLFVGLVINPALAPIVMKLELEKTARQKRIRLILSAVIMVIAVLCYLSGSIGTGNLLLIAALFLVLNLFVLSKVSDWFQNNALVRLENAYEKLLRFSLRKWNPVFMFLGMFVLLIGSVIFMGARAPKVVLFPSNDPTYINVFVETPIGTEIEKTNAIVSKLEDEIIDLVKPYGAAVESIIAQVGENATDPTEGPSQGATPNKARISVSFVEYDKRQGVSSAEVLEQIREAVQKYPGALITVEKNRSGPPVGKPINIEVVGEDYEKLISLALNIKAELDRANVPGVEELKSDLQIGSPELIVKVDREKARRFGLSTGQVAMELRTALFGKEVSKFKDGEEEYPINLRLDDKQRYDVDALMNKKITFRDMFGKLKEVPILSVATVEYTTTYGAVKRKDLNRVISISSNVKEGYNANEIVATMKRILADYEMPEGYYFKFTGEQEEQAESSAFLRRALLVAVFAVFLIIVTQFNSVIAPFIIVCSIVFSTIGVFLGLAIFKMDFVIIMTGIGIISLAGVVVNNAIVLIDYTNYLRKQKREELGLDSETGRLPMQDILESIVQGGKTRLRPVLLTAITTVLGLIPLATGLNIDFFGLLQRFDPDIYWGGDNALFWGPMAWTVIFGLTFATFLTLVIVPVMYLLADKASYRFNRLFLNK